MCQCARLQMCPCANVPVCKCSSVQMCQCANVPVCKSACVQVCKCANVQMCNYANVQMCKYANVQVYKCASMPMCKYANVHWKSPSMPMCKNANVQECQCVKCKSSVRVCKCSCNYANLQVRRPVKSLNVCLFFSVSTRLMAIGLVSILARIFLC